MALRYEPDVLLNLRESPLCVKPKDLPPREEWMGPPPETVRPAAKTPADRFKTEGPLLEQGSRRPGIDRHGSRNGGSSDGIILGPPRTNFSSTSRTNALSDADRGEKVPRDSEFRDRFLKGKFGAGGADPETRGSRSNNFRGRGEDRDNEGWSTVKPRKSFGQEGAERFTGRMGGDHRHKDDRVLKERDDIDAGKDRRRTFDAEGEEGDAPRRNGLARGRSEPWFKDSAPTKPADGAERQSNRERIEKAKSWRAQDPDDKAGNSRADRGAERYDRRWDKEREQRPEREPEWLDEPLEPKDTKHTEADFRKFMENMKAGRTDRKAPHNTSEPPGLPSFFSSDPTAVKPTPLAPAVEKGPDKFFAAFGEAQSIAAVDAGADRPEPAKAATAKPSRFANLFQTQSVEVRGQVESPAPTAAVPAAAAATPPPPPNGGPADTYQQSAADKQAFAALLSKLAMPRPNEHGTPTPPNVNAYSQPPPQPTRGPPQEPLQGLEQALAQKAHLGSPEPLGSYGMGHPEEQRLRSSVPPAGPEILAPRPVQPPSQPHSARPEQMLQELVSQRHNTQSQGSGRADFGSDQNSAFLMQLMQNRLPDQRPIEQIMRHPQPQRQASIPHFQERDPDFVRDRIPAQQRQMRPPQHPQGIPGRFIDGQFQPGDGDGRMMQAPQILQRQQMGPPGLEAVMTQQQQQQLWPGQPPPPSQRQGPMILPPGLQGNRGPSGPMPPGMPFPGNMPPGVFPHGENMVGAQRGVPPPPGFFTGGPPPPGPGFLPLPPGMVGAFPGGDPMLFPGGPFDGRGGMPPPGAAPFRR